MKQKFLSDEKKFSTEENFFSFGLCVSDQLAYTLI